MKSGMSIGMVLISLELMIMLVILLFLPREARELGANSLVQVVLIYRDIVQPADFGKEQAELDATLGHFAVLRLQLLVGLPLAQLVALLAPLKTVEPFVVRVDRASGAEEALRAEGLDYRAAYGLGDIGLS